MSDDCGSLCIRCRGCVTGRLQLWERCCCYCSSMSCPSSASAAIHSTWQWYLTPFPLHLLPRADSLQSTNATLLSWISNEQTKTVFSPGVLVITTIQCRQVFFWCDTADVDDNMSSFIYSATIRTWVDLFMHHYPTQQSTITKDSLLGVNPRMIDNHSGSYLICVLSRYPGNTWKQVVHHENGRWLTWQSFSEDAKHDMLWKR